MYFTLWERATEDMKLVLIRDLVVRQKWNQSFPSFCLRKHNIRNIRAMFVLSSVGVRSFALSRLRHVVCRKKIDKQKVVILVRNIFLLTKLDDRPRL